MTSSESQVTAESRAFEVSEKMTASSQLLSKVSNNKSKQISMVWDHFTILEVCHSSERRAVCTYCGISYAIGIKNHGTSSMKTHLESRCKKYPFRISKEDKIKVTLAFQSKKHDGVNSGTTPLVAVNYSLDLCRQALARMLIVDELPFRFVEHDGFRYFCSAMQPMFPVPSRTTAARDCIRLFVSEKEKLKNFFTQNSQRICLTTDTWKSIQNLNYMCLTAHFIDNDWNFHKKILNFRQVPNHKGETIGRIVESCLLEWGIHKKFTVTVDNASSNNGVISYLKKRTRDWDGTILGGEFMHMRCCAHIVNLIVTEGLKDLHDSIIKIRNAVKYVKSSPSRYEMFKGCVDKAKIACKGSVCLDVPTRWNSTYMMLEVAQKFERAFDKLLEDDKQFVDYFEDEDGNGKNLLGPPTIIHWDNVKMFVKLLKLFYEVTLRFYGSLFVTSNVYFHELCVIQTQLTFLCASEDSILSGIARNMHLKYLKYWGDIGKINLMLFVAIGLDPRYKLKLVNFWFKKWHVKEVAAELGKKVERVLTRLYDQYSACNGYSNVQGQDVSCALHNLEIDRFEQDPHAIVKSIFKIHLKEEDSVESKSEVERYLTDVREDDENPKFFILSWWKANTIRYLILSQVARDVLAILVSTVASESAFSTEGRVLDPFQSSLSPMTVEALICTQNWLRSSTPIDLREAMEGVESYESLESELTSKSTSTVEPTFIIED